MVAKSRKKIKEEFCVLAILVLITLFLGAGMGHITFFSDDIALLDWGRHMLEQDFVRPWFGGGMAANEPGPLYYRPLTVLSHGVDYEIWGLDPAGHRYLNLLLHLACSFLVYLLARRLMPTSSVAPALAAFFFALHPSHELTIWWIACRMELLCAFFYLLSVLAFTRYLDSRKHGWLLVSTLAGILALCSKEMAYSLPLVLGAIAALREGSLRQRLKNSAAATPMAVVAAMFLLLRFGTMPKEATTFAFHIDLRHTAQEVYLALRSMSFPYRLSLHELISGHPVLVAILAVVPTLILALQWRRIWTFPVAFAAIWVVLTFIPIMRTMNPWTLYIPSIGVAIAAGCVLRPGRSLSGILASLLVACLLLSFCVHFHVRKSDWHYADKIARSFLADFSGYYTADADTQPIIVTAPASFAGIPIFMHYLDRRLQHEVQNPSVNPVVLTKVAIINAAGDAPIQLNRHDDTYDIQPQRTMVFEFPEIWSYQFPRFHTGQTMDLPWGSLVLHGPNTDKEMNTATAILKSHPGTHKIYYYSAGMLHRFGD